MSPRYTIDSDDSRIFVDQNKLKNQILNLMDHVRTTIAYTSDDKVNQDVAAIKVFTEKEHNAVFLGHGAARIGEHLLPATIVFDTQSDFVMFMLKWS